MIQSTDAKPSVVGVVDAVKDTVHDANLHNGSRRSQRQLFRMPNLQVGVVGRSQGYSSGNQASVMGVVDAVKDTVQKPSLCSRSSQRCS